LILAGVEELIPLYKEVNNYSNLAEKSINKNPEELGTDTLHRNGWEIVGQLIKSEKNEMIKNFLEMRSSNRTSVDAEEIIKGASMQRIDVLFVRPHENLWGFYDSDENTVNFTSETEIKGSDLLNFAILQTLRFNGHVITIENNENFPEGPAAAIFRF
jgi:hypothetical protein